MGEQQFGVKVVQILCSLNPFPSAWAVELQAILEDEMQSGDIVSVDVAAGESHFEEESNAHLDLCRAAHDRLGYGVTIHAGEDAGGGGSGVLQSASNVCRAVTDYRAVRIGHGYQAWASAETKKLICKPAVSNALQFNFNNTLNRCGSSCCVLHFECCPSSAVNTGGYPKSAPWSNHPLKRIFEQAKQERLPESESGFSLPVSCGINTDDPSVIDISLADEYLL